MDQLVKFLTFDVGSDHGLTVHGMQFVLGAALIARSLLGILSISALHPVFQHNTTQHNTTTTTTTKKKKQNKLTNKKEIIGWLA